MANPIWKDRLVNLTSQLSNGKVDYDVYESSTLVYSGTAYADPAGNCSIRLNDIAKDYLAQSLPTLTSSGSTSVAVKVALAVKVGSTTIDSETFYYDWSYDYHYDAYTGYPCACIKAEVDKRMPVIETSLSSAVNVVTAAPQSGTLMTIYGRSYEVVDTCWRYALYYVNEYGGWDWLICHDKGSAKTDTYTRSTIKTDYNNGLITSRGEREYHNEVSRSWTLHSGVLTDAQAQMMHHLVGSPLVYLYDMNSGDTLPVLVTDAQCADKSYTADGRRKAEYTINVQLASNIVRK